MANKFLLSLADLLNDPDINCIYWSADGNRIILKERDKITKLLPEHGIRTQNFNYFHRQLNNYGFRQVNKDVLTCEFEQEDGLFRKHAPEEWRKIKRKKSNCAEQRVRLRTLEKENRLLRETLAEMGTFMETYMEMHE